MTNRDGKFDANDWRFAKMARKKLGGKICTIMQKALPCCLRTELAKITRKSLLALCNRILQSSVADAARQFRRLAPRSCGHIREKLHKCLESADAPVSRIWYLA